MNERELIDDLNAFNLHIDRPRCRNVGIQHESLASLSGLSSSFPTAANDGQAGMGRPIRVDSILITKLWLLPDKPAAGKDVGKDKGNAPRLCCTRPLTLKRSVPKYRDFKTRIPFLALWACHECANFKKRQ